ncbi:MAG: DUF2339 domain-containing protein [Polyangiaceae bacterium]
MAAPIPTAAIPTSDGSGSPTASEFHTNPLQQQGEFVSHVIEPARRTASYGFHDPAPKDASHIGFDWERLVGVRLFAWIGGAALFLAAALFLQFSIQHNLVSPPLRVATGLFIGTVAMFGGARLRARTSFAGNALCGAGVAILYASIYAAHSLYELVDTMPAFVGMAVVTVTAGVFALRSDAYFVALLGLLGGIATPFLLSTGEDRPLPLFFYVTALSVGIVFVSNRQQWPTLSLLGLVGSIGTFVAWSSRYLDRERAPYALFALTIACSISRTPHAPFHKRRTSTTAARSSRVRRRGTHSVRRRIDFRHAD